jgi:Spy/CpxP family protein refolding chaperone
MKIHSLLATTALMATLIVSGAAYAEPPDASHKSSPQHKGNWLAAREQRRDKESVLEHLPPDKAKLFQDTMKQTSEKNSAYREQIGKLREELRNIVIADKFDKDAYLAKNAEMEKLWAQMRTNSAESFAAIAGKFTANERKVLSEMHSSK